jgi:hypothetical protein
MFYIMEHSFDTYFFGFLLVSRKESAAGIKKDFFGYLEIIWRIFPVFRFWDNCFNPLGSG